MHALAHGLFGLSVTKTGLLFPYLRGLHPTLSFQSCPDQVSVTAWPVSGVPLRFSGRGPLDSSVTPQFPQYPAVTATGARMEDLKSLVNMIPPFGEICKLSEGLGSFFKKKESA